MSLKLKAVSATVFFLLAFPVLANGLGKYIGDVVAKWLDDGRTMELQQDFAFVDPSGTEWISPKGSKVDGASIPRVAWTLIGGPFEGKYRNASVIHDVACQQQTRPWQVVHRVFYDAMLASGVDSTKALTMYAAVLIKGPKWSRTVEIKNVPYKVAHTQASVLASNSVLSGEVASTRVIFGPSTTQGSHPSLPPEFANIEVIFDPQPSSNLTTEQLKSLEQEISTEHLTVDRIESRYLVNYGQ